MVKLLVDGDIGLVATGGHIEVVEPQAGFAHLDIGRHMARIALAAEGAHADVVERQARDNRHAVIAALATVQRHIGVTGIADFLGGKLRILTLGLLQTQHIRLMQPQKFLHRIDPHTD